MITILGITNVRYRTGVLFGMLNDLDGKRWRKSQCSKKSAILLGWPQAPRQDETQRWRAEISEVVACVLGSFLPVSPGFGQSPASTSSGVYILWNIL